jgi:uncharacterized membrane protein (UPF0127 family)
MQYFLFCLCLCFGVLLASFGCSEKPVTLDEYYTTIVTLPNGQKIRAEVMTNPTDMMRGMMFRDSLAPDRGMLFVHDHPGRYTYWMYQVRIPLDIIWIDSQHKIVEISADTPPCRTQASGCPQYGGDETAQFVLELAGGMAKKYGLKLGETISF